MDTFTLGLVVIGYLLAIGFLGYKGYRHTVNARDYLLAGSNIHPFVMAMSYGATFISTSAIIGFIAPPCPRALSPNFDLTHTHVIPPKTFFSRECNVEKELP